MGKKKKIKYIKKEKNPKVLMRVVKVLKSKKFS